MEEIKDNPSRGANLKSGSQLSGLQFVIPKVGKTFTRHQEFTEISCKPKLLPMKSLNLMKLEEMEKQIMNAQKVQQNQ